VREIGVASASNGCFHLFEWFAIGSVGYQRASVRDPLFHERRKRGGDGIANLNSKYLKASGVDIDLLLCH